MNDARAFGPACSFLAGMQTRPRKTARCTSGRLVKQHGDFPSAGRLGELLLARAQQQDRVVRYSFFPAHRSLDLLWRHKEIARDFAELPAPELVEELAGEFEETRLPDDAPWIFALVRARFPRSLKSRPERGPSLPGRSRARFRAP